MSRSCERLNVSDRNLLCELGKLGDDVLAVVVVDLDGERLREVEAEDAEDGLGIDDVLAALQQDLAVAVLRDGDKILHALRHFERDCHGLHGCDPPNNFLLLYYT